jgi:hypothetical protein
MHAQCVPCNAEQNRPQRDINPTKGGKEKREETRKTKRGKPSTEK